VCVYMRACARVCARSCVHAFMHVRIDVYLSACSINSLCIPL